MTLPGFHREAFLMAAAATAATAATTTHWGQRAKIGAAGLAAGHRSEHRNGPASRLLADWAIGALGAHGLQLLKLVVAGGAMVFVQRHK